MNKAKRFLAALLLLWMPLENCPAQTGNPYTSGGPASGSDQQAQAADLLNKRGQQKVDLYTGSFGYSIPIACAPARNGSEPNLALAYSSSGGNGWCGMGWNLEIGDIERNTRDGFPIAYSNTNPPAPLTRYDDSKGFMLNLSGKGGKLFAVATNAPVIEYRAEVDTEFLRCLLDTNNNNWTVYDKSGNAYYFGETAASRVAHTNWSGYSGTFHWALDQIITASGDLTIIAYTNYTSPFTGLPERTLYPTQITYNGHTNINGYSANFAGPNKIIFQTGIRTNDWGFSYRWGFHTEQNRQLTNILCQVGGLNVWDYSLKFGVSPATARLLLTNMVVYGFDASSNSIPFLTNSFAFQANPNAVSFGPTIVWSNLVLNMPGTSSGLYEPEVTQVNPDNTATFSYTVADLIDMDGDGLPDRICYDSSTQPNRYRFQKNLGLQANGNGLFGSTNAFGPSSTATTNMTATQAQTASAANLIPDANDNLHPSWSGMNTPYGRIRDLNGDGLPDRVMDYWLAISSVGSNLVTAYVPFTNYAVMLNTGQGFSGATNWPVSTGPLATSDHNSDFYYCVESGGVNVGLFDINGDGLPDRVMSGWYTQGAMTNFLVQFNTGTNFTQPMLFGPYHSQNWNGTSQANSYAWAGIETPDAHIIDINGDGLPDRVMYPMDPGNPGSELTHPTTYYATEYNDGYSFEATNTSISVPGAADPWPGVVSQANGGLSFDGTACLSDAIWDLPFAGLFDLNGDGLPDRVVLNIATFNTTNQSWLVYLNNGHGFNTNPITVSGLNTQGQNGTTTWPCWSPQGSKSGFGLVTTLMDVDGDGLLDRVMTPYDNGGNNASSKSNYFLVQLNTSPFPDLLTNLNNGIGGIISVAYNPSTAYDNRVDPTNPNSVSHLPFPRQVAAAVTSSDGVNSVQTTTYSYAGGFFDGVRREFHGFAVVTNTDPTLRFTVTYFHTGGGRNYAALGEYLDINSTNGAGNFAKAGMAYRVETYGNDNALYHVQVNQVNQTSLGNARYFPFTTLSFDCDYPGNGTPNVTASQFSYDTNGNVLTKVEFGQVSNFNPTNVSFSISDTSPADTRYDNSTYAAISSNGYIVNHPGATTLTDANSNIIQETDYSYNPSSGTLAAKLTRISAGYYATNGYGYTAYGLVGQTTNAVGVQTTITYDSAYNTYPATTTVGSFTSTTSYDARSGQLAGAKDISGVTVTNSFDVFLRPIEADQIPIGGGTAIWMKKFSYPVLKPIVAGQATNYVDVVVNDGIGGAESRTYVDGFGRPIQTLTQGENGNYRVVSTAYDGRGNAFLTTWPVFGSSTNFNKPATGQTATWTGYDPAGRVGTNRAVNVTFNSNGAFSSKSDLTGDTGSPLAARTWGYINGADPWWIICTDADGQVRRYGLDAFGRTNQILEVDGTSTYTNTLKYDLTDNLTNLVNAKGENIYWAYNDAGGVVAMADPYLGQWAYLRDYAGRLRVQTDARGNVISNSYVNPSGAQDALGRLQVQTVYSTNYISHTLVPAYTNTYFYDTNSGDGNYTVYPGQLYQVIDSQGWEKSGYDARARMIKAARYLNINSNTYTTSFTLDDGNNVTSTAYPNSGPTITNAYFHGGSLHQVSLGSSYNYYTINASGYDEFRHATSFSYGNGLTTTRGYYSQSKRLQSIAAGSSGSVFNRTNQYTAGDDITSISGTGLTNAVTVAYYNLHRIKSYSGISGGTNYGYDPTGNITTNSEGGGSRYAYAANRVQEVRTAFGYTNLYDLCGNMIVRHGGLTNSQAMVYDPENRLAAIAQAGVMSDEFGYAFDGTRLWKRLNQNPTNVQVWIGSIYEEKIGRKLFHVFANGGQVCTFETNSALYGGSDTNKVGYYYSEDSLTSSSALSGSSGSNIEVNVYYPFGRTQTASPQANFQVSRRFTGQVFDSESGLYYYNARYYDPELGRFIQPDDIIPDYGNPQSYNRYSYCVNDPLTYNDPSGHEDVPTGASGRAALLAEDSDAAGVVQRAKQSGSTATTVLRTAFELNPIVGAADGAIGFKSGKDAITGEKLTTGQRWAAGGGAVLSVVPAVFKVGGKLIKVGEATAEASGAVKWIPYSKHIPSSNIPWAKIIESTTSGAAKYKPGIEIEKLERAVWEAGILSSKGKPWKYAEFTSEIGASGGKSSRWVRVEQTSGNVIHGHPVTEQEFLEHTK